MAIRYQFNEDFSVWAEKVRLEETLRAARELAKGRKPEEVLEEMSQRITTKMMHPIIKMIQKI